MRKALKTIALLLVVCFVLPIAACGKKEVKRTSYEITATYDETARVLNADMTVNYVNETDSVLDEVCFHLYPAAFREGARFSPVPEALALSAYYDGVNYGGIEITGVTVGGEAGEIKIIGQDEDILSVPTGELFPDDTVKIGIKFAVTLPKVRHRLGVTESGVNFGNFYPIACVYENGAFRTDPYYENGDPFYSDCADYKVSLALPEDYALASTGMQTKSKADGKAVYACEAENVRDFAAVAGKFKMLGTRVGKTDVNYYYYADPEPEKSMTAAADALRTFSGLFGEYPYDVYSVVETGFLQGGMEYPQLSMVTDTLSRSSYLDAVIHETAHQWWYGVVGNDEVNAPWLDEGLAETSTSIFYELNPSYGVDYGKRIADALSAYVIYFDPSRPSPRSDVMTRPLGEYSDGFEYAYCSYVKSELMFSSLRSTIGDEKFFGGLKNYYANYSFRNALPDGLIDCMSESAGRDLEGFFSSWLDGKVKMFA